MDEHPIDAAARVLGSQSALAAVLGVTKGAVSQWKDAERQVPFEHCPAIERATGGLVTCEELRPHDRWSRIPDKSWPWHKKGRPVLDVSKVAA